VIKWCKSTWSQLLVASLAVCVLQPFPALAQDCSNIERLRAYSKSHFRSIRGEKKDPSSDRIISTFLLAGAKTCLIDAIDVNHTEFSCEWYLVKERENEASARQTYEVVLASVLPCLTRPETLTRKKLADGDGEEALIEDPYPGMAAHHARNLKVNYKFFSRWWTMSLEYSLYEGKRP
jgi:hypothetical protein